MRPLNPPDWISPGTKDMANPSPTPGSEKPRRVIKRYSNRKLYDTQDSRYVTLQQIGEMVRAGEEVQIIDNATKEDKTDVTLALIISEDLKTTPRSVPLGTLRDLIQERGERLINTLREGPIGRLIPGIEGEGGEDPAATDTSPQPAAAAGDADKPRGRLSEIVETSKQTLDQWQQQLDERVGAILPGVAHFRELQADVKRLTQRVNDLEAKLAEKQSTPQE
ncbi:MAG: polyhydroxyalkanoate synthesis regulator DNA-binding domain-containing protein [Polyangiaceae bacterium]